MENQNKAYVTIFLIIVNVAVFACMSLVGNTENTDFLYTHGGFYLPSIYNKGEYYRIFTHMFVHSGYRHLLNNMIMLAAVGFTLEERMGHIRYTIVYFIGGLGASALSCAYEIAHNSYAVSIGASGAIMAVFAALVMATIKERKNSGDRAVRRLLFVLAIMVAGNIAPDVNWVAHLGGAITGIVLGALLYKKDNC